MESKKNILKLAIIFFIVIIDYLTKYFFSEKVLLIIPGILEINYARNYGLIYGMFSNNIFLTIMFPLIILGILIYLSLKPKNKKYILPLLLVIAGIIGNLISRIQYGYVIDFIYIPFLQPIFPNFNIADLCVFIGVMILVIKITKTK